MKRKTKNIKLRHNFGHRPRTKQGFFGWIYAIYTKIFGITNLIKRQQMDDLFLMLNLHKDDTVIDLGCSSGYVAMEIARYVNKAIGIDIRKNTSEIPVDIGGNLEFRSYDGKVQNLPLEDCGCNKILVSEVLQAIENRTEFLETLNEKLKDNGDLFILHGVGRPVIESSYKTNNIFIKGLKLFGAPKSYKEYQQSLNREFRSNEIKFISKEEIISDLHRTGYEIIDVQSTPEDNVVIFLEWSQYLFKLIFGSSRLLNNPIVFSILHPVCRLIRIFSHARKLDYVILLHAKKVNHKHE